jgi:PPOX class probable F420-dependent enzyme
MTPAEAESMLVNGHNLSLATIGSDGYPHLVAMSYAIDDGDIVMTSYGKAQKVVNLRRNPRATVMVEHGTAYNTLKGVMIRGKAEIIEGADNVLAVMRLISKRMARVHGTTLTEGGEPSAGDIERARRQAAKRVVIRIRPEKWASWDHSKLAPGSH